MKDTKKAHMNAFIYYGLRPDVLGEAWDKLYEDVWIEVDMGIFTPIDKQTEYLTI